MLQRRRGQAAVLRGVVQAGRGGQAVPVHGAQAARSLDVRAEVFVFVRDRARGQRPAPPRFVVVRQRQRQRQRQTDVPVAVPERQQHVEIGLYKSAERVRVHRAIAEEKAKKTGPEERRRRRRQQYGRQKQIAATINNEPSSTRRPERPTRPAPTRAVVEHGVFRESYFI